MSGHSSAGMSFPAAGIFGEVSGEVGGEELRHVVHRLAPVAARNRDAHFALTGRENQGDPGIHGDSEQHRLAAARMAAEGDLRRIYLGIRLQIIHRAADAPGPGAQHAHSSGGRFPPSGHARRVARHLAVDLGFIRPHDLRTPFLEPGFGIGHVLSVSEAQGIGKLEGAGFRLVVIRPVAARTPSDRDCSPGRRSGRSCYAAACGIRAEERLAIRYRARPPAARAADASDGRAVSGRSPGRASGLDTMG